MAKVQGYSLTTACLRGITVIARSSVGGTIISVLRTLKGQLNLNPLNPVCWIDSTLFNIKPKSQIHTNQRVGFDSMDWLLISDGIFTVTPSHAGVSISWSCLHYFLLIDKICIDRARVQQTVAASMPFDYSAWFQKIEPNEIQSLNLLHFLVEDAHALHGRSRSIVWGGLRLLSPQTLSFGQPRGDGHEGD